MPEGVDAGADFSRERDGLRAWVWFTDRRAIGLAEDAEGNLVSVNLSWPDAGGVRRVDVDDGGELFLASYLSRGRRGAGKPPDPEDVKRIKLDNVVKNW